MYRCINVYSCGLFKHYIKIIKSSMYIRDILNIIPRNSVQDNHLHILLNYILSFDINYIVFDVNAKNPLTVPMKKIKYIIYKKYIDSLQSSTEYSDEYYIIYKNAMHTYKRVSKSLKCINDDYMLSILLQRVPPNGRHGGIGRHGGNGGNGGNGGTLSYIASYQS